MKNKSFAQHLKDIYGDKIPAKVPDEVLDKFVKKANDKSNIKLAKSMDVKWPSNRI